MGKSVLVTGASSGFGLLASVRLARTGWEVFAGVRDPSRAGELLTAAEAAGVQGRVRIVRLDVTSRDDAEAAVREMVAACGRVDAVVCNAGIAVGGFAEEVPLQRWREQFETNVFGAVAVAGAAIPAMRRQRSGRIVLVGSISGKIGFPGLAPYSASKHALEGLGESWRLELAPFGIRVSLVEPGAYRTPIWSKSLDASALPKPESPYARIYERLKPLLERSATSGGDPERVAAVIARALTDRRPKLRYVPGAGERLTLLAKSALPWSWIERYVSRMLGAVDPGGPGVPAEREEQA